MEFIKQYGLRRTGTNYLRKLIDLNFEDVYTLVHLIRSKHEQAYDIQAKRYARWKNKNGDCYGAEFFSNEKIKDAFEDHLIKNKPIYHLISVKNPYSWIWSYHQHLANHREKVVPEGIPLLYNLSDETTLIATIERWNLINENYIQFYQKYPELTRIIPYENLLLDFEKELVQIGNQFNLSKLPHFPINEKHKLSPGYHLNQIDFSTSLEYYLQEKYLHDLPKEVIQLISSNVNKEVADYFNYSLQ